MSNESINTDMNVEDMSGVTVNNESKDNNVDGTNDSPLTNDDLLFLQGDMMLSDEDKALLDNYSDEEDEVSFDASDNNESIGVKYPPLKPIVTIDKNNRKQINLPIGYLEDVVIRTNKTPDSKGYYVDQCQPKLQFIFKGFKTTAADAQAQHVIEIKAVSGDLKPKTRLQFHNRNLATVNELATLYGCTSLLRNIDKLSKLKTIKEMKAIEADGKEYDQPTFDLARYRNTFELWSQVFNKGLNGKPVYKNIKAKDGELDKAGNPTNVIPTRLHIVVYDNRYQLSWSPFIELYNKNAKSSLDIDLARYKYEKTETTDVNATTGGTSTMTNIPDDNIEPNIDNIDFTGMDMG